MGDLFKIRPLNRLVSLKSTTEHTESKRLSILGDLPRK
jgi:hypothetical protein